MPALGNRKQFCPQGHDTLISGRLSNRACRICTAERTEIWRANNPKKLKDTRKYSKLKFFYGIDKETYDRLLLEQRSLCAICSQEETRFARALAVDHDHITGQVRGLLCASCNQGIGHLKDSMILLEKAKCYLGRYNHAS